MIDTLLPPVADFDEMCQILRMEPGTAAKYWALWPHFYATTGRDRRSARFIPSQVIGHMVAQNGRIGVQDESGQEAQIEPQTRSSERVAFFILKILQSFP